MSRMIICFFIVSSMLSESFNRSAQMSYQETTNRFFINYEEVTEEQFNKKLKTLKEIGGWFCKKTPNGGSSGYTCKDAQGKIYTYKCDYSKGNGDRCFITEKSKISAN